MKVKIKMYKDCKLVTRADVVKGKIYFIPKLNYILKCESCGSFGHGNSVYHKDIYFYKKGKDYFVFDKDFTEYQPFTKLSDFLSLNLNEFYELTGKRLKDMINKLALREL